jgi:hypothetical protein
MRKLLVFIFCVAIINICFAQAPTYQLKVANATLCSPNVYEFELFLLNTSPPGTTMELHSFQCGLGYDATILNNPPNGSPAILTFSIVSDVCGNPVMPALSELNNSQVPNAFQVGHVPYIINGHTYNYLNIAARRPLGPGKGSIISSVNKECSHPGTRIGRFRFVNPNNFAANSKCFHIFSTAPGANRTNTLVQVYFKNFGFDVTDAGNNLKYNSPGTCDENILLNPK